MENHPHPNGMSNCFSLEKSNESQMNINEEMNEEISNKQEKQDQEDLSKQKNMEELEAEGILLTEDQFPWEGYTNWQPLRNENYSLEVYKITEKDHQFSVQHVKWLEGIKKERNEKEERRKENLTKVEKGYFWITQNKKIFPSLQAHLARQYQIATQNKDRKENNNRNKNTNLEHLRNKEGFQD
ncbi:hypothetical protein O181_084033 [Austropuccinia psidii MF-1]|uniref:Uncharacterized protein n=1 Tax=Austropuccinia psidii MF-1 TaxID=1389203 RepID=A0A9Q3FUU2_9BASI|nr:hypothetical protein [Austropuccinia psidii MF-1]